MRCQSPEGVILPLVFIIAYLTMIALDPGEAISRADLKAQLTAQTHNFCIIPFIAYGVGVIFLNSRPALGLGLLFTGLIPTSGMSVSWTGLAGGNTSAAVKMTAAGLILGSVVAPVYVLVLMGRHTEVDIPLVTEQIGLAVLLPLIAGAITRRVLISRYGKAAFRNSLAPRFAPLSALRMLAVIFVALALKANAIEQSLHLLVTICAALILFYWLNAGICTLAGRLFLPRADAIALIYCTVVRNLSLSLAVALNVFGAVGTEAALLIRDGYIIQSQTLARHLASVRRFFGDPPTLTGREPESLL